MRLGLRALPGWRGELLLLLGFLAVTLLMTWPIPVSLGQASGLRGDYLNNLWNAWWARDSLFGWHSPFHTDGLYFPAGLSLTRHTLSPMNAIPAAVLSSFLDPHVAFNVLLIATFAMSGWTFSLLARHVTGNTTGGILAGLVYAFNPFHLYYLCQVNILATQYVPLAILFFLLVYQEGGRRNTVLAVLFAGCVVASNEYFVVYTALTIALLLLGKKVLERDAAWNAGVKRCLLAALPAGVVVGLVAAPFIYGTLVERGSNAENFGQLDGRANDLLGYLWIGGPEELTVSWPTMLGYSVLAMILLGIRRWPMRLPWLLVGATFFLLSLGPTLLVNGEDTGLPMPYGLLRAIPGLGLLRKPDRAFFIAQLVAALLVADGWSVLAQRFSARRTRNLVAGSVALLMLTELTGVPFRRFDVAPPRALAQLAEDEDVRAIFELPVMSYDVQHARNNYYQMTHGKAIAVGYCTALTTGRAQDEQMQIVANGFLKWIAGTSRMLPEWIHTNPFDRILLYKTITKPRPPLESLDGKTIFAPFFFARRELVGIRQMGGYLDERLQPQDIQSLVRLTSREFGAPIYEDHDLVMWKNRPSDLEAGD